MTGISSTKNAPVALRIMLADGNIATQGTAARILSAAGHNVVTASNGLAAFKKIAEFQPDLVLLDVYLPGYSGCEICEKMKATTEMSRISVLLTVGTMEPFSPEKAVQVKADGVIIKPFEASRLIPAVEKVAQRVRPPEAIPGCAATADFNNTAGQSRQSMLIESRKEASLQVSTLRTSTDCGTTRAVSSSQSAAAGGRLASAFPHPYGGEICDVCGHINAENACVCQQCDVPLPSSVMISKLVAPNGR